MDGSTTTKSRWGRARFGGGSATLWGTSLMIGVVVSACGGGLFVALNPDERAGLAFAVVMAGTLPAAAALGWGLLVDRSTIAGAVAKPDDSIESDWYQKAAGGAFHDVLLVGGLGAAAFSFARIEASVGVVLAAVVLFAMLDCAARYLWVKRSAT
ncbi:hypothetical protein QNO21_12510 [Microbacterium sp. zg-Y818]|uniref:hypothetical protein n=1 Tax=unclassified Microbacterium TaxID=2609290 RepID=UPI00214BFD5E|nr:MULTISPECIES: hypothetical protein [unclassified Microbacterium]MCR2799946.1 hypothetical protein [Microbacterium sp. zg.Y818]WIM21925.1 hypothetical protein QNO21_12510 [Microbacterium sp. zg-Y818]